jgi:hypothetical protein
MVNFANANRATLPADTLLWLVAGGLIGAVALWALVWRSFRGIADRDATRASFTLAVVIAMFFSWDATQPARGSLDRALGIWGAGLVFMAAVVAFIALAWVIGARRHVVVLGATFLVAAITVPCVPLALRLASRLNTAVDVVVSPKVHATYFKPNVYVFVSDGYPREDVLARHFAFDNEPFLRELSTLGYEVRRDSISNYPTTQLSLATLLEMNFVSTPEMPPYEDQRRFIDAIAGQSAVVRRFRSRGYAIALSASRATGRGCRGIEDMCLDTWTVKSIGDVPAGLLRLTPLRLIGRVLNQEAPEVTLRDMRQGLEMLPRIQPFFSFIHTLPPHSPYMNSSCNMYRASETDELELSANSVTYGARLVETIQCVNKTILETARWIAMYDPGAIVIFLSDHGTRSTVDFKLPMSTWSTAQVAERFSNLLVVHMPPACAPLSRAARSLVNVMEVVFACIEGREPKLRRDRVFIGVGGDNPDYGQVREVTNLIETAK